MIQATTPTLTLTLPDTVDLSTAKTVLVTFSQYNTTLTKEVGDDVWISPNNVVNVFLSQEDTLQFMPNRNVSVQVNWITNNGTRMATSIGTISFTNNLIPEVLSL